MILSPFTNWVLQYFPIGPFWILELAELLTVVGLIVALTDKATTIGLITAITRALTGNNKNFSVSVSPGYSRRIGIGLILVGLVFSAAAVDAIASAPATIVTFGTGGPSLCRTLDLPSLYSTCPASNSGAVSATNSTLCTAPGNPTPGSTNCSVPCNDMITPPLVECDVSSLTGTGTQTATATINFGHAFTNKPSISLTAITANGIVVSSSSVMTFLATDPALNVSNTGADAEIINHRAQLPATLPANTLVNYCFTVTGTTGLTIQGKIKYSTNAGVSWNDFSSLNLVSLITTGFQCATVSNSATLSPTTTWIAPFTTNGGPDSVLLTNIAANFLISSWAWMSINVQHLSVTTTSFKWQVRSLVAFSTTFTVSWTAIACQSSTGAFIDCPQQ